MIGYKVMGLYEDEKTIISRANYRLTYLSFKGINCNNI